MHFYACVCAHTRLSFQVAAIHHMEAKDLREI